MKIFFFSIVFLIMCGDISQAQINWQWAKSGGGKNFDEAASIVVDINDNVYVAGYYTDSSVFSGLHIRAARGSKMFFAKYSSDGSLVWIKTSLAKGRSEATAISLSQNSSIFLTGNFTDSLVFDDTIIVSNGNQNLFLVKYDLDGHVIWVRSESVSGGDRRKSVASDADGNVYVCGNYANTASVGAFHFMSKGNDDIFIVKYSSDGNVLWAKSIGADAEDGAFGIALTPSANVVVTGSFGKTVDFGGINLSASGTSDIFVVKFSSGGNLLWAKQTGDTIGGEGSAITIDKSENIYVTGKFYGYPPPDCDGYGNVYIAKYSSDGLKHYQEYY